MPTSGAMAFPDTDNDLVADPPTDPAKLIKPDTLVFSYVATEEEGPSDETWKELLRGDQGEDRQRSEVRSLHDGR